MHAKSVVRTFAGAVLAFALALPVSAQSYQAEFAQDLETVKSKYLALAENLSDDAMAWRPMEGVRSTNEVFMHAAAGNMGLANGMWGAALPAGVDADFFQTAEEITDRAEIIRLTAAGFDYIIEMVQGMSDAELQGEANLFGRDSSVIGGLMIIHTHAHEHLGQLIAYTRANGEVPPWSN